ncbi:MAG: DUF72 domain-containing protein [Gemmatimonadetes bacterium]|nr:DUF72 domain-containing protein [Gemmatimonadota bacterium]
MSPVRVGTASWTDKTLLASGWYPEDADDPASRLEFYASQFPLVEVDSTYYTPPNERNSRLWAERTPEGFTFDIKAYSLLTQHPTRTSSLYKDLRPATDKRNVYLKDLDEGLVNEVWERFLAALEPLHDSGRLGSLLFQFPPWFGIRQSNKHYILECKRRCEPYRMCVELRNNSWMAEENMEETLDFLTSYAVPYVVVDMPQGHRSSVPPVVAATADHAVVRFHGHSDKWESKEIYERFGYLYSEDELKQWVPKVEQLAEQVQEVHVLTNNCYRDYAQVNARQLVQQLDAVAAPGTWPPPSQAT